MKKIAVAGIAALALALTACGGAGAPRLLRRPR